MISEFNRPICGKLRHLWKVVFASVTMFLPGLRIFFQRFLRARVRLRLGRRALTSLFRFRFYQVLRRGWGVPEGVTPPFYSFAWDDRTRVNAWGYPKVAKRMGLSNQGRGVS